MSPSSCVGIETTSWQELVFLLASSLRPSDVCVVKADLVFSLFRKNNKRYISLARKVRHITPTEHYLKQMKYRHCLHISEAKRQKRRWRIWYQTIVTRVQLFKTETNWLDLQLSAPGCKRIIVDPQYLESLKRPNVNLKWDAIEAIVEDGIKLKTGVFIPLDVIIFGTGYSLVCIHMNHEFLATFHCFSRLSRFQDRWTSKEGAVILSLNTLRVREARKPTSARATPDFRIYSPSWVSCLFFNWFYSLNIRLLQDQMLQLDMRLWFLVKKPRSA